MTDENIVQLAKESDFGFIRLHPFVFTVNEIQKCYTVQHNTLILNNNVIYVSVNKNHHRAPLLQKCKKKTYSQNSYSSLVRSH